MHKYIHNVKYYETDRMGITHHSNYVRWMEEARMDLFSKLGWGYEKLEGEGIISPVISIECKYMQTTTFPDEVEIRVTVEKFNGVRMEARYDMYRLSDGERVNSAQSSHCFVDADGKIVNMKKKYPELFKKLNNAAE